MGRAFIRLSGNATQDEFIDKADRALKSIGAKIVGAQFDLLTDTTLTVLEGPQFPTWKQGEIPKAISLIQLQAVLYRAGKVFV